MVDILDEKKSLKEYLLRDYLLKDIADVYAIVKNLLIGYSVVAHPCMSTLVYRIRNNKDIRNQDFYSVQDFWFPREATLNRLNVAGESVLYCSSLEEICFSEIGVKDDDIVSICGWKVDVSKINLINMGFRAESRFICGNKQILWGDYRRERLSKLKVNPEVNTFIDNFLFDIFTEPSGKFYKISACVGKLYLHNEQETSLDAIIYPSVKRNGKGPGFNLAFSPDFAINNLIPVCFRKYILKENKPHLVLKAKYTSDKLRLEMPIIWESG